MSEPVGLDVSRFDHWLRDNRAELVGEDEVTAELLQGGLSNLTYRIDNGSRRFVLRRPPLGHVLSTAHDMAREFRVISGLANSAVPVPGAILYHDDSDGRAGVGTPFYLMEFVDGRVLASVSANRDFTAEALRQLSFELVEKLADLHDADPRALGLAELGHPDGYLERQLRRWATQYDHSASRELTDLDELQRLLIARVPGTRATSLIHGDFRLDNAIVQVDEDGTPHIAAVLDWEMATIGDSFSDLGLLGLYWDIRTVSPGAAAATNSSIDPAAGYPTFPELVERYAVVRGIDITQEELAWYIAFAAYKLAIIIEGIYYRYTQGKTVGAGFEGIGAFVTPLACFGIAALAERNT